MKFLNILAKRFCIDSRKIKPGMVFVAIKGNNHDGHDFIIEAFQKGASYVVTERRMGFSNEIVVEDTVEFLLKLAAEKIENSLIIGVTGSAGKTFTKELLHHLLPGSFKSAGNMNTEIGLPLTILNDYNGEEISILEFAMDKRGDIKKLCSYFKPAVGVVLNVGRQHIGVAGSEEEIFYGKMELVDASDYVVYFGDDLRMRDYIKEMKKMGFSFGLNSGNDITLVDWSYTKNLKTWCRLNVGNNEQELQLNGIWHKGFLLNLAASLAVIRVLNKDFDTSKIEDFKFPKGRFNWIDVGNIYLIDDTYNASLKAFENAIEAMLKFPVKRRLAVVGPILEQGRFSQQTHEMLSNILEKLDGVIVYDSYEDSKYITPKNLIYRSSEAGKIVKKLSEIASEGDVILFKASRMVKMENILNAFRRMMGW